MKIKYPKLEEIKMIKFLSFRSEDPRQSKITYMSQTDVAKFLSKSPAYVQKICTELRLGKHQEEEVAQIPTR